MRISSIISCPLFISIAIRIHVLMHLRSLCGISKPLTFYPGCSQYGGLTLVTLPIPFMVAFDMPRYRPVLFHVYFCLATWYCGLSEVIQIKECNFFNKTDNTCFGKDFLAMSEFPPQLQASLTLKGSRFCVLTDEDGACVNMNRLLFDRLACYDECVSSERPR